MSDNTFYRLDNDTRINLKQIKTITRENIPIYYSNDNSEIFATCIIFTSVHDSSGQVYRVCESDAQNYSRALNHFFRYNT